jgi:hypothetical protein
MKKPTKKTLEYLEYGECQRFIEKKYKINTCDYANSHRQFYEWCDAKGYGQKDSKGNDRGSSQIWFAEYQREISAGLISECPYQNFWHFITDTVFEGKGQRFYLSKDLAKKAEKWQKHILELFIKEFGEGPYVADW